jgi:hypothetical protein
MEAVWHKRLGFESLDGKRFVGGFQWGRITSDGGGSIRREIDLCYGLTAGIARALGDPLKTLKNHTTRTLIKSVINSSR